MSCRPLHWCGVSTLHWRGCCVAHGWCRTTKLHNWSWCGKRCRSWCGVAYRWRGTSVLHHWCWRRPDVLHPDRNWRSMTHDWRWRSVLQTWSWRRKTYCWSRRDALDGRRRCSTLCAGEAQLRAGTGLMYSTIGAGAVRTAGAGKAQLTADAEVINSSTGAGVAGTK